MPQKSSCKIQMSRKGKSSKKSNKWTVIDPSPVDLAIRMSSQESMTSQSSVSMVSHEESVLELYCQHLGQMQFDKAKDLVDTEKDGHKFSSASSWGGVLQCLSKLAVAERHYANLVFLKQQRFSTIVRQKDNLKSIYNLLLQEFQRMQTYHSSEAAETLPEIDLADQFLAHISGHMFGFLKARTCMIDVYEHMSNSGTHRQLANFSGLCEQCEDIGKIASGCHHPLLAPIRTLLSLECESLSHLFQAQGLISKWNYLPSALELHQAHSKLNTWQETIYIKEVKSTFGRSSSKSVNFLPSNLSWLLRFKSLLMAKFGLYFYDVLLRQTLPSEMKANLAKLPEDFVSKIQAFHRKYDASHTYLVLNSQELPSQGRKGGYNYPGKYVEPLQGLETFPPIFAFPGNREVHASYWPTILMCFTSHDHGEPSVDKIKYVYEKATEKRSQASYFIVRVDPYIHLVVIFESKKSEKDSSVNSFLTEMASQLRCQSTLASLKNFARS